MGELSGARTRDGECEEKRAKIGGSCSVQLLAEPIPPYVVSRKVPKTSTGRASRIIAPAQAWLDTAPASRYGTLLE